MLLAEIARASADVADTRSRLGKVAHLAGCLAGAAPREVGPAVAYLSGLLPQGTIGVGWAALRELPPPAGQPSLELLEVDAALTRIAEIRGAGSQARRREELDDLFGRATEGEQDFLTGLLLGGLRQGALEGVMTEAVAKAAELPAAAVRRALMLSGDLGEVAEAALAGGPDALARFRLEVLRPIQPMLAQTADDVGEALERAHPAALEWKLDGARIQAHRLADEVRLFTRNLADMDGRPEPFQVTMSRFGSRVEVERLREAVPLSAFFFDCLHLDGEDLLDRPAGERLAALEAVLPDALRVPRVHTDDAEEGTRFLADALAHGHEGVMVKSLDAPYEAGRRGAGWLKVKVAHTLDLVVLAVEWGSGRRRGKLSNIHLGARDAAGGFVMLGKTFKGMTDELLAWQTERLLELETHREGHVVHVRPELVVEIAFDGVQASSRYPGGLALRFARVKGYRPDKRADEADTIDTVRAIHAGTAGEGSRAAS